MFRASGLFWAGPFSFDGNCRNGVFENQRILSANVEKKRKFIKAFYSAGKSRALQQMNDDIEFFSARRV
jgi:hypothetical protein